MGSIQVCDESVSVGHHGLFDGYALPTSRIRIRGPKRDLTSSFSTISPIANRKSKIVNFFTPDPVFVPPPPVKWWGMKHKKSLTTRLSSLKSIIQRRWPARHTIIRQFGQGKLVRLPNGRHEFIGGTDADCRDALLWASLFAHTITFDLPQTKPAKSARPARKRIPDRHPPTGCAPAGFDVFGSSSPAIA